LKAFGVTFSTNYRAEIGKQMCTSYEPRPKFRTGGSLHWNSSGQQPQAPQVHLHSTCVSETKGKTKFHTKVS